MPAIGIAGMLLTAIAIYILISIMQIRIKSMALGIIAAMMVTNVLLFSVLLPWLDPFRSARGFTEEMNRIISSHVEKTGEEVVLGMVDYRSAYRLYGDYPIVELATESGRPRPDLPKISDFF